MLWRTLSFAALLSLASGQSQSQAEKDLLAQAERTVDTFCPVDFAPLNLQAARADLVISAGVNNPIYQTVLDANIGENGVNTNILLETVEENFSWYFIVQRAFAFVLLILLLILWFGGCWCFLIPCCQRWLCRCCEVHHELGKKWWFHVLLWVFFLALATGMVVSQAMSFVAYNNIDQGIQGTACYSAQLVRDVVNGNQDLNFSGVIPVTDTLETMANILEPSSPVMVELRGLLTLTEDLKLAMNVNFAILRQLLDLVGDPQNAAPAGSMHKCQICQPVESVVRPLLDELEGSVAFALFLARMEVEAQLSGPQLTSLRQSIRSTMAPLKEIKAMVVEQIGFYMSTAEGGFQSAMAYIRGDLWTGQGGALFPVILGLFLLCILIVIHGLFSLGVFGCCGGRDHDPCCVRYSSGYSLCSSYCYAMFLLLLGGIMVILSTVGSGVCLVMIDFDRHVGKQLLVSLGVQSDELDEVLDMALNLTDQCMSLKGNESMNRNLVDLIQIPKVNPSYEGETSTPRKEVVELAIQPIQDAFAEIDKLEGMVPTISTLPEVDMVLKVIGQINMKSLIWADPTQITADPKYRAMNPAYYLTTLNCPDVRLGPDLPEPLANTLVPGIDSMAMNGYFVVRTEGDEFKQVLNMEFPEAQIQVHGLESDMASPVWSCPGGFTSGTCGTSSTSNPLTEAACAAGKRFLDDKKLPLVRDPVFVCRYFQLPGAAWGTPCDLGNMTYQNPQCVYPNGSLETFTGPCTLDELANQISGFEDNIRNGLIFLDNTVAGMIDTIKVTMRRLVDEHVITPVMFILNGLDCSFMRHFWSGLTSSLCLRSIAGFHSMSVSYVVAAILSLLCAAVMYVPWRVSRDNEDIWETTPHEAEATDIENREVNREVNPTDPAAKDKTPESAVAAAAVPHVPGDEGNTSLSL